MHFLHSASDNKDAEMSMKKHHCTLLHYGTVVSSNVRRLKTTL